MWHQLYQVKHGPRLLSFTTKPMQENDHVCQNVHYREVRTGRDRLSTGPGCWSPQVRKPVNAAGATKALAATLVCETTE